MSEENGSLPQQIPSPVVAPGIKQLSDAAILTLAASWIRRSVNEIGTQNQKFGQAGAEVCLTIGKRLIQLGHGKIGIDLNAVLDQAVKDHFPNAVQEKPNLIVFPGRKP